ncbi:MAG: hypothetical protein JW795_24145 [Chitinivibrionales bacterium]|nr:hypothetical protein [Chitinivibrionales bacterium]
MGALTTLFTEAGMLIAVAIIGLVIMTIRKEKTVHQAASLIEEEWRMEEETCVRFPLSDEWNTDDHHLKAA